MNDSVKPELLSVADRLATLPSEVQQLFAKSIHGTPDNISPRGCQRLAKLGKDAWNAWREAFPAIRYSSDGYPAAYENYVDFSELNFGEVGVDFREFKFGDGAKFSKAKFGAGTDFENAQWGDDSEFMETYWAPRCNFRFARWGDRSCFVKARWDGQTNFFQAQWGEEANFSYASFGDESKFQSAMWGDEACFKLTLWGADTDFIDASWHGDVEFKWAHWGSRVCFKNASWLGNASFVGAQFGEDAKFYACTWMGAANFSASSWDLVPSGSGVAQLEDIKKQAQKKCVSPDSFVKIDFSGCHFSSGVDFSNRQFKKKTVFSMVTRKIKRAPDGAAVYIAGKLQWVKSGSSGGVKFGQPPIFHGCELHQDTSFDGAEFPPATGSDEAARAYRTLKLAFNKQQALREEQRFFRLEMAEEAKSSGKAQPLYWLYRVSSDYGFSLWRPFVAFLVLLLVFAQVYGYYSNELPSCWLLESACESSTKWYEFSLAQALPFSGFDKLDNFKDGLVSLFKDVPVLALALHKALSLAALFLMGLALRNLFRLK